MARNFDSLTAPECDALLALYERDTDLITPDVVAQYDLKLKASSLQAKLRVFRNLRRMVNGHTALEVRIPPSTTKRFIDYTVVEWDNYIVISDVEIPDHSALTLKRAVLLGMAKNIKKLIIAGDLIATDQQSLNEHIKTVCVSGDTTYEEDVDLTNGVLDALGQWFDEIIVIEGNHDDRISRATKGAAHLGMLIKGDKVRYSRYHFLWVKSPQDGEYTYICHQRQYSPNSVVLGRRLYNPLHFPGTRQKAKRLILGHTHQSQTGFSEDGLCEIFGLGTCRDPERTQYAAMSASTHPKWKNAFVLVQNDFAYNITEHADWRTLLGEFYIEENQNDKQPV